MWDLVNRTRFAVASSFARDREGAESLLVAIRATFTIGAARTLLVAEEQAPVARTPAFVGDPARSSLLADVDFAPPKTATDVVLLGHACTVEQRPSIAVVVGARVGAWEKRLVAIGDRRWRRGAAGPLLDDPAPFVRVPLLYERAYGGARGGEVFEANPVGRGYARKGDDLDGLTAPNLEDPRELVSSPYDRPRPMSLGPVARAWLPRRRLAGTFDDAWRTERRPLPPADFDHAFWQCAPPDQRAALLGGEPVELTGVAPTGALRFDLPRLRFAVRSRLSRRRVAHPASLATVVFEPDLRRVSLVFVSALAVHHALHELERTIVEEEKAA
jgi:hypothetical protein